MNPYQEAQDAIAALKALHPEEPPGPSLELLALKAQIEARAKEIEIPRKLTGLKVYGHPKHLELRTELWGSKGVTPLSCDIWITASEVTVLWHGSGYPADHIELTEPDIVVELVAAFRRRIKPVPTMRGLAIRFPD